MPPIKIKHIVSFSSEDKNHPADNLLKDEQYRKWKCAPTGEKTAYVTMQLEKATEINTIDIGNEGSAFIEVLVNRADSKNDFQVLLVSSLFMNPMESKSGTNLNRVRMFTQSDFNQTVVKEKWDMIKFVCTQPFNKTIQFGLSFVKLHSPTSTSVDEPVASSTKQAKLKFGAFSVKADDINTLRPGSLFASRKNNKDNATAISAGMVRDASIKAEASFIKDENAGPKISIPKMANSKLPSEKRKLEESISKVKQSSSGNKPSADKRNLTESSKPIKQNAMPRFESTEPHARKRTRKEDPSSSRNCPFGEIMSGVVFALSGFQNPYRGELREKALEMGAKYRPDWDKMCTHLVCAFLNTPKFIQVQGQGGKIVSKEWILDCYRQKKKISWKKYKMSDSGVTDSTDESDRESNAKIKSPEDNSPMSTTEKSPLATSKKSPAAARNKSPAASSSKSLIKTKDTLASDISYEDDGYDLNITQLSGPWPASSNSSDTEDEINRVNELNKKEEDSDDVYNADTDVEDETPNTSIHSASDKLPDYFSGLRFFLYGEFNPGLHRLLNRYIIAFKGIVENYINSEVKFVITEKDWNNHFDEALEENSKLTFVRPEWIFACNDNGKLVPHQPHVVPRLAC